MGNPTIPGNGEYNDVPYRYLNTGCYFRPRILNLYHSGEVIQWNPVYKHIIQRTG